jgi:DNA-binding XRE family transcriptional regulator
MMTREIQGAGGTDMNHLRPLRTSRELALWGLAARSGVSATTLSAIERWDYSPSDGVRRRIAAALDVEVDEIWPAANCRERKDEN